MISTRSAVLVMDTIVCLTLAQWETVSGHFRGYLTAQMQMPGVSLGNEVGNLPPEIAMIWSEIRGSTSQGSYTSAVLMGRKLLMHVAVDAGAKSGLSFVEYVDYLVDNHYAPPKSKDWVDKIRSHGNEQTMRLLLRQRTMPRK